jgi:hypothetical protein
MAKEFMLLIRNRPGHQASWTPAQHSDFLKKCEAYIGDLKKEGKLIAAQPLLRDGIIISGKKGTLKDAPLNDHDIQVGYYHILAADLDEAVAIAKRNPEFEFSATAKIEVRPVKMKEENTGFAYPR